MIYALSKAVTTRLREKKFVIPVVYGPELVPGGLDYSRIVIERDRDGGEDIQDMGAKRNARLVGVRFVCARATVWAKSSLAGAAVHDHEEYCDQIVDALYCAVSDYMHTTARVANFGVTEAKFLSAAELVARLALADASPARQWPGVAYSLRWRMPRGMHDVDYQGAALPEADLNGITGEVRVRRNADDPPEIVPIG